MTTDTAPFTVGTWEMALQKTLADTDWTEQKQLAYRRIAVGHVGEVLPDMPLSDDERDHAAACIAGYTQNQVDLCLADLHSLGWLKAVPCGDEDCDCLVLVPDLPDEVRRRWFTP